VLIFTFYEVARFHFLLTETVKFTERSDFSFFVYIKDIWSRRENFIIKCFESVSRWKIVTIGNNLRKHSFQLFTTDDFKFPLQSNLIFFRLSVQGFHSSNMKLHLPASKKIDCFNAGLREVLSYFSKEFENFSPLL
jgi:hypothetical protein